MMVLGGCVRGKNFSSPELKFHSLKATQRGAGGPRRGNDEAGSGIPSSRTRAIYSARCTGSFQPVVNGTGETGSPTFGSQRPPQYEDQI